MAKLIGNQPQQVPTNGDLGTMAFMDYDVVAPQFLAGGRRNLIINGAMQVAQRGTSFSGSASDIYTLDRWVLSIGSGFNFDVTATQSSDAPSGFASSLKITPDTVQTPAATQNGVLVQRLEGQNLQQLAFGTSDAKSITVSFWVKSNKTGTYTLQALNYDAGVSSVLGYTVDSSDTWEKKILTFNGDTTNSFDNDNGLSMQLFWHFAAGSSDIISPNDSWSASGALRAVTGQVNFMDSTSNEFYITGVQLEVGSVATPFEYRSYGEELALCKRYYQANASENSSRVGINDGYVVNGVTHYGTRIFPVTMRAAPTIVTTLNGSSNFNTGTYIAAGSSVDGFRAGCTASGTGTGYFLGNWTADAEL